MRLRAFPLLYIVFCATAGAECWQSDAENSSLEFVGEQASAKFTGKFTEFEVLFCANDTEDNTLAVQVDLNSTDTLNEERDEILLGPEFFDVDRFPVARYSAKSLRQERQFYKAKGKLLLRGVEKTLPLTFELQQDDESTRLAGTVDLRRLVWGVGQGEWQDTQWVANLVTVRFSIQLIAADDPEM